MHGAYTETKVATRGKCYAGSLIFVECVSRPVCCQPMHTARCRIGWKEYSVVMVALLCTLLAPSAAQATGFTYGTATTLNANANTSQLGGVLLDETHAIVTMRVSI